jgi:hypothetical protein
VSAGTLVLKPRVTIDFLYLMIELLDYPGLTVAPDVDVDSMDTLPLLTVSGFNGHAISNGGYQVRGFEWTLSLSLYTDGGLEQAVDLADTVYQIVHGMEGAGIVGVGAVNSVEDGSMFDRVGAASLPDKTIVQQSASFTVRVSPA